MGGKLLTEVEGREEAVGTIEESEPSDHTTDNQLVTEVAEIDRVAEDGCPENREKK